MTDTPPAAADAAAPAAMPSSDELATATATFARVQAAIAARMDGMKPDLRALVTLDGFGAVLEQVTALRDGYVKDRPAGYPETPFEAHLNAIATGMANLKNDLG